jgi:hypothetical protein
MQSSQDSEASRLLREGREAASLEIETASQLTRIPQEMIRALEEGRWEALPGAAYARAFARTLSGAYGLDPEIVVAAMRRDMKDPSDPQPQRQTTPQARLQTPASKLEDDPKGKSSGPFVLLGALALALLLLIGLTRIDDLSASSAAPSVGAIDSVPDTTARLQADTARIDTTPVPPPRHVAISIRDTGSAFLLYIRAGRVRKSTLEKGDSLVIDPDTTAIFRNLSNYSLRLSGAISRDTLATKYFRIARTHDTAQFAFASEAEWKALYDKIMERRKAKSTRDGN